VESQAFLEAAGLLTGKAQRSRGLSGSVGGSYNPEQIDVKTSDNTGEAGNGSLVRLKSKQNFLHPGEFLINYFQAGRGRQNSAFYGENSSFLAIYLLNSLNRAIVAGHTLAERKYDQQQA
jgi:hypothetical protein